MNNQNIRLRVLDQCFRSNYKHTIDELIEKCSEKLDAEGRLSNKVSVSERLIRDDIKYMRSIETDGESAPIKVKNGQYFYEPRDYSYFSGPIKEQETAALLRIHDIIKQFPAFEQSEELAAIIEKLFASLQVTGEDLFHDQDRIMIDFEKTEYPSERWMTKAYEAVRKQYNVLLSYQPFSGDGYETRCYPYLIKEYNGRWYLVAYSFEKESVYHYAFDRIINIQELDRYDFPPADISFDAKKYYSDKIGVTPHAEGPIEIKFEATGIAAELLKTKPLHHTQENEGDVFTINVHPNMEVRTKLWSFGPQLKMIEPVEFLKLD